MKERGLLTDWHGFVRRQEPEEALGEISRVVQDLLSPPITRNRPLVIHPQQVCRQCPFTPNQICLCSRYPLIW